MYSLSLSVQSAITSVSFPRTLSELRAMCLNWLEAIGEDWKTDLDVLSRFPSSENGTWIAPKWLSAGDLLFFYHTKSARGLIRNVKVEARKALRQSQPEYTTLEAQDVERLITILDRVDEISEIWTGKIFAVGEVSGSPERAVYTNKHFKGTIYAPLASIYVFERPISSDEFKPFLKIEQNTTTPVYREQFTQLKDKLGQKNDLPRILQQAVPISKGFRDVNKDNWIEIVCRKGTRFVNEAQLRAYWADTFLDEIKDGRTSMYTECDCYRNGQKTGIADYFIRLGNKLLPVETKVNIRVEQDILSQIAKYIHIDAFIPTKGTAIGKTFEMLASPFCLVIDQQGLYLINGNNYVNCSPDKPLFKREDLSRAVMPRIRDFLINQSD